MRYRKALGHIDEELRHVWKIINERPLFLPPGGKALYPLLLSLRPRNSTGHAGIMSVFVILVTLHGDLAPDRATIVQQLGRALDGRWRPRFTRRFN